MFLAARAECAGRGSRLSALVAEVFDPTGFGRAVVDDWDRHTDVERDVFTTLADRVVGADERARARRELCRAGAIVSANVHDADSVWIKFRAAGDAECSSLIFEKTSTAWRYRGEWFCGVTIPLARRWKAAHGNGDFDAALAYLHSEAVRAE